MQKIIDLLERKSLCYRSFYKICDEFLDQISRGDTAKLEQFQKRRQSLLNVLEQLEFEITHQMEALKETHGALESLMTPEIRTKIQLLFSEKDSILRSIMDLDAQIIRCIEKLKDDTLQKLQSIHVGSRTLCAYTSPMAQVDKAEDSKIIEDEA